MIILSLTLISGCAENDDRLMLSGTLETYDHDLVAPVTAQLLTLYVNEGDRIAVGDTVAVLDTIASAANLHATAAAVNEARARLADWEAGSDIEKIRGAESNVEIARSNLKQAKRDFVRIDSLALRNLVNEQSLQQARLIRDNAESSLRGAEARLADLRRGTRVHMIESARAAVQRAISQQDAAQHVRDQMILVSAHTGVVQWLPYQIGEYVPAGRPVATIHSLQDLWARVYVPEDRLNQIRPDQKVKFSVDAFSDQTFTARVAYLSATAEFTPRNVQTPDERLNLVFAVKLIIGPNQPGLRAGMPADFLFE